MRKLIILTSILFLNILFVNAQITVVTDDSTYTPTSNNAIFEVHSSNGNKGILVPRLTTAQRTAIATSGNIDQSLLVFDTDTKTFWFYDGSAWVEMATGGSASDDQLLTFSNDTLYIEDGNWVYLGDYKELPQTAINGQVLTWNGSAWVAQNSASGSDNWGTQVVESDNTLNGDGTSGNPLSVNGDLTDDQNLSLSGNNLDITGGTGVDLSQFMDNTDNQTLSFNTSTNYLTISNGNSVDLSSLAGGGSGSAWELTGNSGTSSSNFIGTTDNVALNFKIDNTEAGKLSKDNTYFGYQAGYSVTSGTYNSFFGYGAGKDITTGGYNTALGYCAINRGYTTGSSNIGIGKYAMFYAPSGDYNIAIGNSAYSLPSHTGSENVYIGAYTEPDNNDGTSYAVALGSRAISDANYATAIGYKAYANQTNSLILGQTTNDGNPNSASSNTHVGINTIYPSTGADLTLGEMDNSHEGAQVNWYGASSYGDWITDLYDYDFRIWSNKDHDNSVRIWNNNSSYVTDLRLADGTGYAAGGWQTSSDKRIKSNIKAIPYGLNEVMKLKPTEYDKHIVKELKNGQFKYGGTVHSIGFIAQDVYKVIPYIVHKPKDEQNELWSLDYAKLTPVLVKAIQELKQQNDEQKVIINELKAQNKEILERLKKLEEK